MTTLSMLLSHFETPVYQYYLVHNEVSEVGYMLSYQKRGLFLGEIKSEEFRQILVVYMETMLGKWVPLKQQAN